MAKTMSAASKTLRAEVPLPADVRATGWMSAVRKCLRGLPSGSRKKPLCWEKHSGGQWSGQGGEALGENHGNYSQRAKGGDQRLSGCHHEPQSFRLMAFFLLLCS